MKRKNFMANRVNNSYGLSRRALLKGFGAGAAALGLGATFGMLPRRTLAQDAPTLSGATAFYRFNLGELEITVLQDFAIQLPATNFAVNASEEEVTNLLTENNYRTGDQPATVDLMLVKSGDTLALLDTGIGTAFGAPARLLPTLDTLGIAPADVTNVIISHFHIDHISSVSSEGALVFPNASVHISQTEWDFLQNPPDVEGLAEQVANATGQLHPAVDADQLFFYNDGDELLPGVQAIAAPGHSIGHFNLLLSSGGQQLLNMFDTANHHLISLANPDWHFVFDAVPDQAAQTRRAILQRAVDEKLFVFGYHWPFPGVGVVDTDGEGFRFIPAGF
jgi:glyoxylase-like metal-dependent hydrolase (beta-lactamase superfamily II)